MIDEFKGVIAQNCEEYQALNNIKGTISMSLYGENCANCVNYRDSKCIKNVYEDLYKTISNN